jgi:hypothetical protein
MSKGESVTSGLAINAVGIGMLLVGFQPWWGAAIASIGAVIALIAIFQPDPVAKNIRRRLRRLAQAAQEAAVTAKTDDEFEGVFYAWRPETIALRDFVQAQYGLRARDFCMDNEVNRRDDVPGFVAGVNELADRVG